MIKKLLAEWLEERRLGRRPPLPQDATIYIMAFVEWAEKKSAEQSVQLTGLRRCPSCKALLEERSVYCDVCGTDTPRN